MKRVIREVLPTGAGSVLYQDMVNVGMLLPDCSPKKTNLNFLSGFV